ncbi:hypothetical protein B0H17DRAFT_1092292 [Mycena rosella]|uniref:Annexin n=1 Tax=Mycena rosella TaxID=1033263 RepID=A0AAD7G3K0_MYCRO|nr:hypothetical protein B0H17DRAFT_1092292 [Mycena rosella]
MGLVLGPLQYDATQVYDAIAGAGTKEKLLNEIVLGLSPSDVALLAVMYRQKYNKVLSDHVTGDLKGDTKKLFALQLAPGRSFATASDVSADANSLHKAGDGKFMGKDEDTIFAILMERPYAHLKQVSLRYREQHKKSLADAVESKFRGDAEDALVWLVRGFETHRKHPHLDPASVREAEMLEQTMKGMGTKDELLLMRLLRAHWSRGRMADVCAAYKGVYGKALSDRVKGETSGAHEDLLMALIQ